MLYARISRHNSVIHVAMIIRCFLVLAIPLVLNPLNSWRHYILARGILQKYTIFPISNIPHNRLGPGFYLLTFYLMFWISWHKNNILFCCCCLIRSDNNRTSWSLGHCYFVLVVSSRHCCWQKSHAFQSLECILAY